MLGLAWSGRLKRLGGKTTSSMLLIMCGLLAACGAQSTESGGDQMLTGSVTTHDTHMYWVYMAPHFEAAWQELGYSDGVAAIRAKDAGEISEAEYEAMSDQAFVRAQEIAQGQPCDNQGVSPLDGSEGDFAQINPGTEVTVLKADGTIVGTTDLSPGTIVQPFSTTNRESPCQFRFSMGVVDTDSEFFSLLIAGEEVRTYTREEIDEQLNWILDFQFEG